MNDQSRTYDCMEQLKRALDSMLRRLPAHTQKLLCAQHKEFWNVRRNTLRLL